MLRLLVPSLLLLAACHRQPPTSQSEENGQARVPAQAAAAPGPSGKLDRSHSGTAAPQSEFDDPEGDTVTLASFAGKPVLLNLWATWCGPCVREMPSLDRLAAAQGDKLQVVALSQDDGREKVDAFLSRARLARLEPYMDPKLSMMAALRVEVLPTTILFDSRGREVWRVTGDLDWQSARAAALVGEAYRPG